MERNKMVGLIIAVSVALSSVALFVYAPSTPRPIRPGDYSGRGFGRIAEFVDQRWALLSPSDTNGLDVVSSNPPYVLIAPGDVNETAEILNQRNVVWYRDAVIELNGIEIDGRRLDLNVYGFVLPTHGIGEVVPVDWQITINADGSYTATAQEVIAGLQ